MTSSPPLGCTVTGSTRRVNTTGRLGAAFEALDPAPTFLRLDRPVPFVLPERLPVADPHPGVQHPQRETIRRDRQGGVKRSLLTDGPGLPVGLAVAGINQHDMKLTRETLDSRVAPRPQPMPPSGCVWIKATTTRKPVILWSSSALPPTSAAGASKQSPFSTRLGSALGANLDYYIGTTQDLSLVSKLDWQ